MEQRLVFLGDFSGLSLFLSRGVAANGSKSVLYSNGDGWKGIPSTNKLFEGATNPISRAWRQIQGAGLIASSINSLDTLVLSTEFLFNRWIDAILLGRLIGKAGRTVLLHAGCSDGFHRLNFSKLLCRNCKLYDLNSSHCVFDSKFWPGLAPLLKKVDLIVPFTDIYRESAQLFGVPASNVTEPLHLPIDFEYVGGLAGESRYQQGVIHGQNRIGFKGTVHLRKIMDIDPSLSHRIELLSPMPFVDFIDRLNTAEIVLDQLFANGYGMTGALALATGTSVAYGYTSTKPSRNFDGLGCLGVPITGDACEDARALGQALGQHLQNPPDRNEVINAARVRHDHINVGQSFLNLIK